MLRVSGLKITIKSKNVMYKGHMSKFRVQLIMSHFIYLDLCLVGQDTSFACGTKCKSLLVGPHHRVPLSYQYTLCPSLLGPVPFRGGMESRE